MKKSILPILILSQISSFCLGQTVNVSTSTALQAALTAAVPGQTIVLADGVYTKSGGFVVAAGVNGTANQPITLKGSSKTILTSGNLSSGYGLWLKGNTYWVLDGFYVRNSAKGVVIDNSYHNTLQNLTVTTSGDEGIHLRTYSSYNTIQNCHVDSTGWTAPTTNGYAEGIYIGSANSNWGTYTNGSPDTCNYNTVTGCTFGNHVGSENIDIKEGTVGGIISYNSFNGAGCNGANSADSWIDVKGNYYTISCNTGQSTIKDGFQSHIDYTGFGDYNTFSNNNLTVGSTGYGINLQTTGSKGTATHNVVCTNNTVSTGTIALSNVATIVCPSTSCTIITNVESEGIMYPEKLAVSPNPSSSTFRLNTKGAYSIYDLSGVLFEKGNCEGDCEIGSNLAPNVYLLEFQKEGQTNRIKIVKQ